MNFNSMDFIVNASDPLNVNEGKFNWYSNDYLNSNGQLSTRNLMSLTAFGMDLNGSLVAFGLDYRLPNQTLNHVDSIATRSLADSRYVQQINFNTLFSTNFNTQFNSNFSTTLNATLAASNQNFKLNGATSGGNGGFAFGQNAKAGHQSFSFGAYSDTSLGGDVAMGYRSAARAAAAIAIGNQAAAYNTSSIAIGQVSRAFGNRSFSLGFYTSVGGEESVGLGVFATVRTPRALAFGYKSEAERPGQVVLGQNNKDQSDAFWNIISPTDPLFILGNGNGIAGDDKEKNDAFTILRNGKVNIAHADYDPNNKAKAGVEALEVNGHTKFNGTVILTQPAGDISMGVFTQGP